MAAVEVERVEIEQVAVGDAAELAPLIAAFRDHLASRVPTDAQLRLHLPTVLGDPSIEFSVARLRGQLVGYTQVRLLASIWAPGVEAYLEDLFVQPVARGQSVGRALLRHVMARVAARGATRITLSTNDANELAHHLYRAEGLAPVSHALYPNGREVVWGRELDRG